MAGKSRWSAKITQDNGTLDLKGGTFAQDDPKHIARSLKSSAEHSKRRKANALRSAMSMLTFHINRAGQKLSRRKPRALGDANAELRRVSRRPTH